jgi:predicted aspartyl protease
MMRFPYSINIGVSIDTGEQIVVLRPEVFLRVHGPAGDTQVHALVDTGSDNSILPMSVARKVGITTTPGSGPGATTYGGHEIPLSFADVDLELADDEHSLRWPAHVYFAEVSEEKETALLGHQGFLDFFTATFDGEECVLELEPNSDFPSEKSVATS